LKSLVHCIRREYVEWPRLSLTLAQAARLWHTDQATCARALKVLLDDGYLLERRDGRFVRRRHDRDVFAPATSAPDHCAAFDGVPHGGRCQVRPRARATERPHGG
jgi:hypothetical protein